MADVAYRHGDPQMIDYTPSSGNVTGGTVVLLGNTTGACCGIVHTDITNSVLGAVAVGGGFYDGVNLSNAANYAKVYWDNSAKKFTTTSTNNALFGFVVESGAGGANTTCTAFHWPFV